MILGQERSLSRNLMKAFGKLGYRPGSFQLDPDHFHTGVPMSTPGDRVWQGVQKNNCVGGLIQAGTYNGRDVYLTNLEKTARIQRDTKASVGGSMGPATFAQLMGMG